MGVYSGTPTRVMPHTTTGRADYFGPMVNRAARYCHAAARGGQVLLPKELMCEVSTLLAYLVAYMEKADSSAAALASKPVWLMQTPTL